MFETIQSAVQLPGFENWRAEVDVPNLDRPMRRPSELDGDGRFAAVMILVYQCEVESKASSNQQKDPTSTARIVLTRRHDHLSKHAGQISLPGGQRDEGESLEQTAVRESVEEIGIQPENVLVLGRLNDVYIPPSDFTVTPFVGWHHGQPRFVACESEVAEIIEVQLDVLLEPSTMINGTVKSGERTSLKVPYYQIEHHQVWGATAIILGEFLERVRQVVAS